MLPALKGHTLAEKLTKVGTFDKVRICEVSRADDRGCKSRKGAGEESPGFTGQDAG